MVQQYLAIRGILIFLVAACTAGKGKIASFVGKILVVQCVEP